MLKFLLRPLFAAIGYTLFRLQNSKIRGYLFAFFRQRHPERFLCVDQFQFPYIVHTSDNGTSREVYRCGQLDLEKFQRVVEILSKKVMANRRVLLDVGANLGTICIPLVGTGQFERAIAVEPDPLNLRLLRTNIAFNELQEHILVLERAAADDDNRKLLLELSAVNTGDHRIAVSKAPGLHHEENRNRIEVQSITIDSIVESDTAHAEEFLIWMDVQGYEGWALTGAKKTLACTPPLVLEFWPYGMRRAGSFGPLQKSVAPYKYFVDLSDPGATRLAIDDLPVLYNQIGENGDYTDLILLPDEE